MNSSSGIQLATALSESLEGAPWWAVLLLSQGLFGLMVVLDEVGHHTQAVVFKLASWTAGAAGLVTMWNSLFR